MSLSYSQDSSPQTTVIVSILSSLPPSMLCYKAYPTNLNIQWQCLSVFQSIPTKYLFSIFLIIYLTHPVNLCVLYFSVSHFSKQKEKQIYHSTVWNENIFCHICASLVAQMIKKISLQCGRPEFNPWVGKIPWRRAWQTTPVFLPGESPWTEEPGRLQSMESQRVGHDWASFTFTFLCSK